MPKYIPKWRRVHVFRLEERTFVCLLCLVGWLVGSLKNVFRLAGLAERLQEEVSELMPSTSHVQVITSFPSYE